MIGFRWSINKLAEVFIIEIKANNEYVHPRAPLERYTTDCIVKSIVRKKDGKQVRALHHAQAYFAFDYYVGQHITGTRIYYCSTMEDLKISQGRRMEAYDIWEKLIAKNARLYKETKRPCYLTRTKELIDKLLSFKYSIGGIT